MDGVMQEHYLHGVPSSQDDNDLANGRIAVVFRHGRYAEYSFDSGEPLKSLKPQAVIQQTFGQVKGLVEGECYSRLQIRELGAHRSPQGGISGNRNDGCDAIVVAGARSDGLSDDDRLDKLIYAAESKVGAAGILTSMKNSKPIRVFRSSSNPNNPHRACIPSGMSVAQYRYDGLYRVEALTFFDDKTGFEVKETTRDTMSAVKVGRTYRFQLERIQAGKDAYKNVMTIEELVNYSICNGTLALDSTHSTT